MTLRAGDKIERYTILELLGRGGMGEVYRAQDERLHRVVALKVVSSAADGRAGSSEGAARMMREARAAAALDHPNVVTVYDVGEVDQPEELRGTMYLAMELIRGKPLREYIGAEAIAMKTRVAWLVEIARALAAAHKIGVVHRDIKPENVMIREDDVAKVLDFGIAKRSNESAPPDAANLPTVTGQGVVVGTPYYMSPEQLRGEKLDGRADQFSWGVLAYELVTGAPPWSRGAEAVHLVAEVLSKECEPPSLRNPKCPKHVEAVIQRALSKKREDRFPTMAEVATLLEGRTDPHAATQRVEQPVSASTTPETSAPHMTTTATAATTASRPPTRPKGRLSRPMLAIVGVTAIAAAALALWPKARETAPVGCASNRACVAAHGGEPWICRAADRRCVAITSEDCNGRFEPSDLQSDDTLWIGAMFPQSGAQQAWGKADANALDLARREFVTVGGIPGKAERETRSVALVVCDTAASARRAAAHLVELEVPAVIGVGAPLKETIDATSNLFISRQTLVLDVLHESPLITRIPQPADSPRLVWRLTASAAQFSEALAHLISDFVEPKLRRTPAKLAIIHSERSQAVSMVDAAMSAIRLNGKPLADSTASFRSFPFRIEGSRPEDHAALVEEVVAFAPHIVVYTDFDEFEERFLEPIERAWRGQDRPFYLSRGILGQPAIRFAGTSAERRRRLLSVELPANTDENLKFVFHYNELFDPKISPGTAPGVVYDAFYVAAFAAASARKPRVSGLDIALGMMKLGVGDGERVPVGPSAIFQAFDVLRRTGTLRLKGAGTLLDLDSREGELSTDFAIYCLGVDPKGRASAPVESGQRYEHATKKLSGVMACP
jgi:serine/threonine-protein kinase